MEITEGSMSGGHGSKELHTNIIKERNTEINQFRQNRRYREYQPGKIYLTKHILSLDKALTGLGHGLLTYRSRG